MRLLLTVALTLFALVLTPGSVAAGTTVVLRPARDLGLPFWCQWGYDWDERCYTDDFGRLPVGGVDDKVWRSALTFAHGQVPQGASVGDARLRLWFDGICVAPRRTSLTCPSRSYELDVHRIESADWLDERELEFDPAVEATETAPTGDVSRWLEWDVGELVRQWLAGAVPNNGFLLKLGEAEEAFDVSGPYLPSMSYPNASVRPQLVITYS
jgi:hypothetical protein